MAKPDRGHHKFKGSRKMPHAGAGRNTDGSIDLNAIKDALPAVSDSFLSGEYRLLDMQEVALADGTELFIVHRERMR